MAKKFPLEIIIGAIDKFSSTFATVGAKLDRLGRKADRIGKTLTTRMTAPLAIMGGLALRSAGNLEQLEIRFSSLLGSADAASAMMDRLKVFAAATPFELNDVAEASAQLLAAGFAADDLEGHLKTLGDIAAGSGGNLADMVPLFTEIRLKGKAFTQDLRQFATRGIPIVKVLAEQLGVSEARIFKMAEQGKISFALIEKALRSMTVEGGLFANQMEKQSQSIFGLYGALKDTAVFALAELGQAMARAVDLGKNMVRLGNWIKGVTEAFTNLSPATQKFIVWAGIFLAVLGPLLIALGALITALTFMAPAFAAIFSVGGAFVAFLAATAGLAIYLGHAFADLVHEAGGFGNVLLMLGGAIVDMLITPLTSVLKLIVAIWDALGTAPAGLRGLSEFSFAQAAANRAVNNRVDTGGQSLGTAAAYRQEYALQQRALKGDKAAIEILFKNAPAGMKASVVENQGTNVTVDQGISMQGGY